MTNHAETPSRDNAEQHRAFDVVNQQERRYQQANQRKQNRYAFGSERTRLNRAFERKQRHERWSRNDNVRVLQADKAYEQSDTDRHRDFQRRRNCVEDRLTDVDERQQDKNYAFDENRRQRLLPRVTHADYDRVREIGVKSHARAQHERHVRQKRH